MTTALALFDRPVHEVGWVRPPGNTDYAVTGQYLGIDLVNGGIHRATDVGNLRLGDPVLAPRGAIRARGLRNYSVQLPLATDALGVEIDFGHDLLIQLWHLSVTLPVADELLPPGFTTWGPWQDTDAAGATWVGRTGNTGAQVGGKAMPGHTHIEAEDRDVRFDIEPYLLGHATLIDAEEDAEVDFSQVKHQRPKIVRIRVGAVLYKQPTGSAEHWRVDKAFDAELFYASPTGRWHGRRFLAHGAFWFDDDAIDRAVPFRQASYAWP